jgi:phage portal protein BeeE
MNDYERQVAREWLESLRGATSQAALVTDIEQATGWRIGRERYSRYESGGTPFGRSVLQHFVDYWAAKGQPGPDFTPPAKAADRTERMAAALELIAESLMELRKDMARNAGANLGATQHLGAQLTAILERMPDVR